MTQQRLCDLVQISIEESNKGKIDFSKIMKELSNVKVRKKTFY